MRHELWYTSAPRGLDLGSSGFCTVKVTRGISPQLRELLERMSQYRHTHPPGHQRANENPVVISCVTATGSNSKWHILSRICDAGADHTNRTNFFAHHIAYDAAEGTRDPAWLASQPDTFATQWDSRTEELDKCRELPTGSEGLQPCAAWRAVCGDAGWAGAVADAILEHGTVYLVSDGTRPLMPLIAEVASLLPKIKRTELTFSTHYLGTSSAVNCQLRCVLANSDEAKRAVASRARVFDLALCPHGKPVESPRVAMARTGAVPEPPVVVPEKKVETGIPDSFVASKQSAAAQSPGASRDAAKTTGKPSQQTWQTLPVKPASESDTDASQAWLPVLAGIGGAALCALILIPFVVAYRSESVRQQELVEQRSNDVAAITRELSHQKAEKSVIERDRDDLRNKREQVESSGRIAKTNFDREIGDLKNENEQLKKQIEEKDATHKEDADKRASLQMQVDDAVSAQKAAEAQAKSVPKPAPPPSVRTRSKLPDANVYVRLIDHIPSEPASIEIVGAPNFHLVPKSEDVWDLQQNDITIAKFGIDKTRQPPSLRFGWVQASNKTDDFKTIYEKLKKASLQITTKDNETIVLPLFYTLAPAKDETATPPQ